MARTASPPPPAAVIETADRLHSAAIHLLRALRRTDADLAGGPARLSALSVLVFGGPCSINSLARAEGVRLPTMSRLVSALERNGLVARAPDPRDRRATIIRPTTLGRRVLLRGRERRVAALARRLGTLAPAERLALKRAASLIERIT